MISSVLFRNLSVSLNEVKPAVLVDLGTSRHEELTYATTVTDLYLPFSIYRQVYNLIF